MSKIYKSNLNKAKKFLKKGGSFKASTVKRATQKNKKISAVYKKDNKRYSAGNKNYSDFTLHNNEKRRLNYCKRASGIINPSPVNKLAMEALWNCHNLK